MVLGAVASLVGAWMTTAIWGPAIASIHWDRYLRASIACEKMQQYACRHPKEAKSNLAVSREMYMTEMLEQLRQVAHWYPGSARAHLRLASRHLEQFELLQQQTDNVMGISQIRDAALASGFSSSKELRVWLTRAFGKNAQHLYQAYEHAWLASRLCPLQGEAYLHLANLCFLAGQKRNAIDAYVDQCLRVRPQDNNILFEVGKQQLLLGRFEQAIAYWARAFHSPGSHQLQIIQHMAGPIPAAAFIEVFHPGWQTLGMIWKQYFEVGRPEDLKQLGDYAARTAEAGCQGQSFAKQSHIWLTLAKMQSQLGQTDTALASLRKAHAATPGNFQVRYALGFALLKTEQYHSAESHLRWCLERRPENHRLRAALVSAAKGRLSNPVLIARRPSGQGHGIGDILQPAKPPSLVGERAEKPTPSTPPNRIPQPAKLPPPP